MYTLSKKSNLIDQLELKDENGNSKILDINLRITPETVQKYRNLQVELINLQKKRTTATDDAAITEEIGKAVASVIALLFGESNLKELADFYDGDFTTMLADLFPYIQNKIVPNLQKMVNQRKQQLRRRFK